MDGKNFAMVVLSITLLVSLGFNTMPDPTHGCESREIKAHCFELSSTLKTCYTVPGKIGGKRCTEGWKELQLAKPEETRLQLVKEWSCSPPPEYSCTEIR